MRMQATTTTPLFAATLRPDRSLRLAGGWVAFAIAFVVAVPFLLAVEGFLLPGLVAFVAAGAALGGLGLRQARRGRLVQQVTLWPDQLEIATIAPGGARSLRRFEPQGLRLRLVRDENERTTAVFLRSGVEETEIGAFLSPDDKSSFAKAFGSALRRARQAA